MPLLKGIKGWSVRAMSNNILSNAVKQYVSDLKKRCRYSERGLYCISDNEHNYLLNLYKAIKNWGNEHKLFYAYTFGKLSLEELKKLLGICERNALRYIENQRNKFIEFVNEQEIFWFCKYPFANDKIEFWAV